jgi:hypothetical protein
MRARKVVQTEVDTGLHARLVQLAAKRDVPLKALVRDALAAYVEREERPVEDDPIFKLVGSLKLKGRSWSKRKDWRP